MRGVDLFNRGYHWEAHELFEDVWRIQSGEAKILAQAFVQTAAAFSSIKHKKYQSVLYLFDKSVEKFESAGHLLLGVNIPGLLTAISRARSEVQRLGEEGLDGFEQSLYPRIRVAFPRRRPKRRRKERKS